jgi:AhpD family alkylhydroperoxidase
MWLAGGVFMPTKLITRRRRRMQPRIASTVFLESEVTPTLKALGTYVTNAGEGLPVELVMMRVSQINGCSVCVQLHGRALTKAGESDERIWAVAAWRESAYFTDAERAALALGEAVTRLSDRPDPVSDQVWDEAARHFDERQLATLVLAIGSINLMNRLNVATRQVTGSPPGGRPDATVAVGS